MVSQVSTVISRAYSTTSGLSDSIERSKTSSNRYSSTLKDNSVSDAISLSIEATNLASPPLAIQSVRANTLNQYTIESKTRAPEATATTLGSGASTIVIELQITSEVPQVIASGGISIISSIPTSLSLIVGGTTHTVSSASQHSDSTQTLMPGNPADTDTTSLTSDATDAVTGSSTSYLFPTTVIPLAPLFIINGSTYTYDSTSRYFIDSQTLEQGGSPITISGTPISMVSDTIALVLGTSTVPFFPPHTASVPSETAVNGISQVPGSASNYPIASQTLIPGSSAITISGTFISLASDGLDIILGTSTMPLSSYASSILPKITFNGQTYAPDSASNYLIAGQTLIPGASAITISGTPVSLVEGASDVILGTVTFPLLPPTVMPTLSPLTIDNSIYTANSASDYAVAGQTLSPGGPAITISGTPISLAPAASDIVVGTSTIAEPGVGGYILSGIGGSVPNATATAMTGTPNAIASGIGIVPFAGDAGARAQIRGFYLVRLGIVVLCVVWGEVTWLLL